MHEDKSDQSDSMRKFKQVLPNVGWLTFERLFRGAGSFLVGIWLARYLGREHFGVFNYVISFSFLFSFVADLGLEHIVVREIVKNRERENEILGTAFILKLVGGLTALSLSFAAITFLKGENNLVKYAVLLFGVQYIFKSLDVIYYFFRAHLLNRFSVIAKNSAYLIVLVLNVFLIFSGYGVIWFVGLLTLDVFLAAAFLLIGNRVYGAGIKLWTFDGGFARKLLKDSWPLAASVMMVVIYTRIDQVMIGDMLSNDDLGAYAVAARISEAWYFFPESIVNALFPYFVSLRENDSVCFRLKMQKLLSFMIWIGIIAGCGIFLFGEPFLMTVFGEQYSNAYQPLVILTWSGIFVALGLARRSWIIAENLQKYRIWINLIGVCLNVLGNLILIPLWGITGAAVASLLTQMACTIIAPFLFKPLREIGWLSLKSFNPKYLFC